jgi:hypothetical protein
MGLAESGGGCVRGLPETIGDMAASFDRPEPRQRVLAIESGRDD